MGLRCKSVLGLVLGLLGYFIYSKITSFPDVPVYPETWWGRGVPRVDEKVTPFNINVDKHVLDDLKTRLENVFPLQSGLEGVRQNYGINSHVLNKVLHYWKNSYNWTERQDFLNKYPHFTTNIQGLKIHFLHVKPKLENSNAQMLPLLLLHGWPGSVREFYEMIPILSREQKGRKVVFEVIVPSLPGYGWSEAPTKPGLSPARVAQIMKNLMKRLGHDRFLVQGGDWGAIILSQMSVLYPEHILGAHSNLCACMTKLCNAKNWMIGTTLPSLLATEEELPLYAPVLEKSLNLAFLESGYSHIQATKPDTIGVGLRDSPIGLAAYILEKFSTWTNPTFKNEEDGGLTRKFTMDQLLDNVMIYWVTRSITTSQRLYAEMFNKEVFNSGVDEIPSTVPTACARFKHELVLQPESLLRHKFQNLVQVTLYQDGGHFAGLELPEVLARDVYDFVEKIM